MGQLGLWSYNVVTGETLWSPGFHRLIGSNPADDKLSLSTILKNVHPDDRRQLLDAFEQAAHGMSTTGFTGVAVSMLWSDMQHSILFGVIEQSVGRRKRVYATDPFRIPSGVTNEWHFVQLPTVGGIKYEPRSILRFGALLDASVADTAARL
jgi:hypothetical protein